jgi:hypothetical protein
LRRILLTILAALVLAACGASSQDCQHVPASFFRDIEVHGKIVKSSAVKSDKQTPNGHDIYEVAAKFNTGEVAVWSTGISLILQPHLS